MEKNTETKDLRKHHRALRDAMTAQETAEKSEKICEKLLRAFWYPDCRVIYGYYPLGNEVDCLSFLQQALADGKTVALPRTKSGLDCSMDFYRIHSLREVEEGAFHVMEPLVSCEKMQEEAAVILVPGMVFDRDGNRYGYGKGYYDRYLSRFPYCKKYALAFEHQMEDAIEVSDTDICMDGIYTDENVYGRKE